MGKASAALLLGLSILLAGCGSSNQRLVGTWKGEIVPPTKAANSLGSGITSFFNSLMGPLTLEFNAEGKYKASVSFGSETGTYTVQGNQVTLKPDKNDGKTHVSLGTMVLSDDGKSLSSKKEFASDTTITLKKQP